MKPSGAIESANGPRNVIVPFMGFTERTSRLTGIETAWHALRTLSGPDVWILTPQRWNTDAAELVKLILRNADGGARLLLIGHSWGVGVGCIKAARSLQSAGRTVWGLVSADGVYRSGLLPDFLPLNFSSLFPGAELRIPSNVRRLWAVYQREGLPYGHRLAPCQKTDVREWLRVHTPHSQTDETPQFQELVLRAATEMTGGHAPLEGLPLASGYTAGGAL